MFNANFSNISAISWRNRETKVNKIQLSLFLMGSH